MLIDEAGLFFNDRRLLSLEGGIGRKQPYFRVLFWFVGVLSRWSIGNFLLLAAALIFYRGIRNPSNAVLFQLGLSANNERMFRRLNSAAGYPQWNEAINGERAPFRQRLLALAGGRKIRALVRGLTAQRSDSALAHTQLVLCAAAFAYYDRCDLGRLKLVCISCDHSPVVMGLLAVARERGLRTCYIQHAPVADYFPPLNYDLAILFDHETVEKYQTSALSRGVQGRAQIVFMPPFRTNFVRVAITQHKFRIGICLGYLFREQEVGSLIASLADDSNVASVILRRHPRCKADLAQLCGRGAVESKSSDLDDFLDNCDIILVPNSGAAIECLHKGKPTFYVAGLDDIEDDYYGFVSGGIVPRFTQEVLVSGNTVVAPFDDEWETRFRRYDATIEFPIEVLNRRAAQAFVQLLS